MRIALILLSILALVFIGSISYSLISQEWGWSMKKWSAPSSSTINTDVESYWRNQIKTEEKIEKLSALVEDLAKKNGVLTWDGTKIGTGTRSDGPVVKLSGKFLALLMPTITPAIIENKGIFDLHIFDTSTDYSTYEDPKFWLRLTASTLPYDTFLKNIRAVWPTVYSVNETKTFPFRSFYLNPPKSDTSVRLVVEIEGQAISIEIPKTKFPTIRDLLLGKKTTSQAVKKK